MRVGTTGRWGLSLLAIVLMLFAAPARGAITPESDVLLPWFEIDLTLDDEGLATKFSVVSASPLQVEAVVTVYTNWGIPVLEVPLTFNRAEAKTLLLHEWIKHGTLPDRTLSAAEVADLQAKLTGKPSPLDGLYYGSAFQDLATGYVIVRTTGDRPDVLWGDTHSINMFANYLEAETLSALTHGLKADCDHHGIRFDNEGILFEGDELLVWSGRQFSPSPTPDPIGAPMKMSVKVYDQAGNHIHTCNKQLIAVESVMLCDDVSIPIGWLEITTDDPTVVLAHLHSTVNASAELHSYCFRQEVSLAGPGIAIEKKVEEDDADRVPGPHFEIGTTIEFEYYVTNTGTVSLSDVWVEDDAGLEVKCPKASLEPGETMVCKATTLAAACTNVNTGTASGMAPDRSRVSASDIANYTGAFDAALTLELLVNDVEADTATGPEVLAGDTLHWTYVVTNSGEVRIANIAIEGVTCPKAALDPGESMTCTAESPALPGQRHVVGTVTGTDPCDGPVVATDPAYYFGRHDEPAITIKKYVNEADADTPTGPAVAAGTTVTWQFIVTNIGNVTLTNVAVTDELAKPDCPKTTLEPGESMTCTATGIALPCQQANTAQVTATDDREHVVKSHDSAHYFGTASPAVTLELSVNGDPADVPFGPWIDEGGAVNLTFDVTNSGDVPLTDLVVSDDNDHTAVCPKTTLAVGESMTCTFSLTATPGSHELVGTVYGKPPCGENVQAQDPAFYRGRGFAPGITIVKSTNGEHVLKAPGPSLAIGSQVLWTYVVTNTGTVALTGITVVDNREVAVTCPKTALEPGESMTCTASGLAQACQYSNTATASGQPPTGERVSDSDDSYYFGTHNAKLTVDKKTNGEDAATPPGPSITTGDTVSWTYVVTNTGDVTLTSVGVTDDRISTVTCPKTTLAVAESMTCTASGTALSGAQRNVATATGTPPCGDAVSATDASNYLGVTPGIAIEKLIEGEDADTTATAITLTPGMTALWSFVVTNTGDVALGSVSVTDSDITGITCPKTTLEPGEAMTCTATATIVAGIHCDTGHASGTSPQGKTVEATDTACYTSQTVADQGCTPGYWKNHTDSWPPTTYSPTQTVGSVFNASAYPVLNGATLLDSLSFGGGPGLDGAAEILLRAATAALLNAAHTGVAYPRTPMEVIADVNAALASANRDAMLVLAAALDADNNLGCPLN